MDLEGSVTKSGARRARWELSASTKDIIGALTADSNNSLRGVNHSRRLFFFNWRKKASASSGKPEKGIGKGLRVEWGVRMSLNSHCIERVAGSLRREPDVRLEARAPLGTYTRFGIGGEAALLVDAKSEPALRVVLE